MAFRLALLSLLFASQLLPLGFARAQAVDPFALYGDSIEFGVVRKGEDVGFHRVRFAGSADDLTVVSEFQVAIKFLFLTAYRFDYRSTAQWKEGQLDSLEAEVDDNGDLAKLMARRIGAQYAISSGGLTAETVGPLYPTNHWHAGVTSQSRVLNTLTGRLNEVQIVPAGQDQVRTEKGAVSATRYVTSGELNTEVWYDRSGRWVKLRFDGSDGVPIELVCRRCQGALQQAAAE